MVSAAKQCPGTALIRPQTV